MCLSASTLPTLVGLREKHQADKAAKTADRRQSKAMRAAAAAQANAAAAAPGQSHTISTDTSMSAAKKARGVQSTFLASRQPTQSTLGVA